MTSRSFAPISAWAARSGGSSAPERSREPSSRTRSRRIQRERQRDGVDELGVRVERDVDLVPQAGLDRERLAAAACDGARGVDLVGGTAEDDELAGELVAVVGERERRGHDRAGDHAVPARVHGLDLAVLADRLDGVVQADDADRAPGPSALDGRREGGVHAADAELDVEPLAHQLVGEEAGAAELGVAELGMPVHELHRLAGVGLVGGYGCEDVCVGDHRGRR